MSKFSQLVKEVAHLTDNTYGDTYLIIDTFLEVLKEKIKLGWHVEIRNFGAFVVKERLPRRYHCPKDGHKGVSKDRIKIIFKPYKALRALVKDWRKDHEQS